MSRAPSAAPTAADWTVAHDFVMAYGGAEWVTEVLCRNTFPGARLVYLAGEPRLAARMSDAERVRLLPWFYNRYSYRALLPTYPAALDRVPEQPGNLMASSYAFVHQLHCRGTKVVYCHSPFRQAWSGAAAYRSNGSLGERTALRLVGDTLRQRDAAAARTADLYVASSTAVERRIKQFYGIDRVVLIPPPIDVSVYRQQERARSDYFLWVGRIVEPYKRLSLVIDALADDPRKRLLVVGDGRSRRALQRNSPPNVTFIGWRRPDQLAELYAGARALIFPSEDDFGIVPLEAMACGTPVIAYRGGGAVDTVTEGESGLFFDEATSRSLSDALARFHKSTWQESAISHRVSARYSPAAFSAAVATAIGAL